MIHILDVSCRSVAYPERYRDTVFTTIVYPELFRDTVFAMIVFLDMYHDTASIVVSFRVPASCVSAVARALPCVCVVIRTHVSLPMFHLEVHCRKCPMQKRANWKASRVTSGTAYSCEVRGSGGVDQVGNLDLSVGVDQVWNVALSRVVNQVGNLELSRGINQVESGNCSQLSGEVFFVV